MSALGNAFKLQGIGSRTRVLGTGTGGMAAPSKSVLGAALKKAVVAKAPPRVVGSGAENGVAGSPREGQVFHLVKHNGETFHLYHNADGTTTVEKAGLGRPKIQPKGATVAGMAADAPARKPKGLSF